MQLSRYFVLAQFVRCKDILNGGVGNNLLLEDDAAATVTALALLQVDRFRKHGIPAALLDALFDVDIVRNHGLLRVRILDGRIYAKKVQWIPTGKSTCWDDWNERQLHWLEGLMAALAVEAIRDVDFIVGLSDLPYCELYQWGAGMPVFVFAQKRHCQNILAPDNSLMHRDYRSDVPDSPYSWLSIVRDSATIPWRNRTRGILWDGDFQKPSREGLEHLRDLLAVERQTEYNQSKTGSETGFHNSCRYKMSLNAEGFTYAMRLKNIFLCHSAVVWYSSDLHKRYEEYWVPALSENRHYFSVRNSDHVVARSDLKTALKLSDSFIEQVAMQGFLTAVNLLQPKMVLKYVARLLNYYSLTLDFNVAELHERNRQGFTLVTQGQLEEVRVHASQLGVSVFDFYYPFEGDLLDQHTKEAASSIDLHHVPCWSNVHRFLQCCSAYFHFYRRKLGHYDATSPRDNSIRLHPFCYKPHMDARKIERVCCHAPLNRIVQLFRNSVDKYNHEEVLSALDRSVHALPLKVRDILQLLEIMSRIAIKAALQPLKIMHASSQAYAAISIAWLYTEAYELCASLQRIQEKVVATPWGLPVFQLLYEQRRRLPNNAVPPPLLTGAHALEQPDLHVMVILGHVGNELALKSLLANRRCPLRLHMLHPENETHSWVDRLIDSKRVADVSVHHHQPRDAARAVCELIDGPCDITYARLVPEMWLEDAGTILILDMSVAEVGPLILADLCGLVRNGDWSQLGAVYAAKYEEHSRWNFQLWSPTVMVMNVAQSHGLSTLRHMNRSFCDWPDLFTRHRELVKYWCQGPPSWQFAHLWLLFLSVQPMKMLLTLPSAWYFVPYEPWLFDFDWDLIFEVPAYRHKWERILQMRVYPGLHGGKLTIFCPPVSVQVPTALLTLTGVLGPNDTIIGRIADDLHVWQGPDNCNQPVAAMGLRWERVDSERPYPTGRLLDAVWVQELVASYAKL